MVTPMTASAGLVAVSNAVEARETNGDDPSLRPRTNLLPSRPTHHR